MKADSILQTIGNTPHIRVNRLFGSSHPVWIKSERANPGGSIKDRIALSMVEAAEKSGALKPGGTIIEPTSGNTGIGLAMVAAVKGYKLILVMPDSMSVERRRLMLAYGASFDLQPREKGMKGCIARAEELIASTPGSWMPQQFENPANIQVHVETTAEEILADFPDGVDVLITGVGTGGHITACAQVLKKKWPQLKVFAVEPVASPVISGGAPAPHPIQGIGAGFIPKNLDVSLLDGGSRSRRKRRARWRAAPRAKKVCWWASPRAPRWRRSRRNCPRFRPVRRCWASTTTRVSATSRSRASCLPEGGGTAAALSSGPLLDSHKPASR